MNRLPPLVEAVPGYGAELRPTVQLDTPTLVGVHDRTMLLQDGRAASIEEVLVDFNKANRHGDSASLDEAERRALAYLLERL